MVMVQKRRGNGKGGGQFLPSFSGKIPPVVVKTVPGARHVDRGLRVVRALDSSMDVIPGHKAVRTFGIRNLFS